MKNNTNTLCAAIFDLDGTLLDSMDVWVRIDEVFLAKRGIPLPADYAQAVCTMSFPQAARYTVQRFALREREESVMDEWRTLAQDAYASHIHLKPGAGEYLSALKARGVKLATATSLSPALSGPALRNNGIHDLFDVFCSTEEVGRGKEFPDVFLLAAEKLSVAPEDCIVFEDILPAVRSAQSAGMTVYCIEDAWSSPDRETLMRVADGYFTDFRDIPV